MKSSKFTSRTDVPATEIDIYQKITELFIEKIEAGVNPWCKTWSTSGILPINYFSKQSYHGINLFLLGMTPFNVPYFCTFNQAKAQGGSIRKGAKSLPVVYWSLVDSKSETITRDGQTEPKKNAFIKYYNVFNVRDVEGIDFIIPKPAVAQHPNEPIYICENIVANMPKAPAIRHANKDAAFYVPSSDYVNIPDIELFTCSAEYYNVLFHELTHSTGHQSRLYREGVTNLCRFGSTNYSKEELVAELGAAFLSTFTGIANSALIDNSAAYLKGWLRSLKEDKKFIFWATKEAQKAINFIAPSLTDLQDMPEED